MCSPCKRFSIRMMWSYSRDLKSRHIQITICQKEVCLPMVQILKGIWNTKAPQFEIQSNGCHFVKKHLKYKHIQISNGWDHSHGYSWSLTIWKLYHLKYNLQKARFSNVSGFKMVLFLILAVSENVGNRFFRLFWLHFNCYINKRVNAFLSWTYTSMLKTDFIADFFAKS